MSRGLKNCNYCNFILQGLGFQKIYSVCVVHVNQKNGSGTEVVKFTVISTISLCDGLNRTIVTQIKLTFISTCSLSFFTRDSSHIHAACRTCGFTLTTCLLRIWFKTHETASLSLPSIWIIKVKQIQLSSTCRLLWGVFTIATK